MVTYFLILSFGMLLIALNIYAMINIKNKLIKWICIVCVAFAFTRYIALIAFAISTSSHNLKAISSFIFASSIGIGIPTAFSLYNLYVLNNAKGMKLSVFGLLCILLPLSLFYVALIIYAPKEIMQAQYGFKVELNHTWLMILSIVQIVFTSSIIFLSGKLFLESKKKSIILKSGFVAISYFLILVDGIFRAMNVIDFPFAYVEVISILSLLTAQY